LNPDKLFQSNWIELALFITRLKLNTVLILFCSYPSPTVNTDQILLRERERVFYPTIIAFTKVIAGKMLYRAEEKLAFVLLVPI
jgi:hypothetical protein